MLPGRQHSWVPGVGSMSADIDIDLPDREEILRLIPHVPAAMRQHGQVRRHNSGVYVTNIPRDPINDCAALDYQEAEARGYFKLDFLNQSVYRLIRDPEHLEAIMAQPLSWPRLWQDAAWASQLVHVGNYTALLADMRPDTIPRMAAFISVIRPGKAHLQNRPWTDVFASVWDGDSSRGFTFKKSHAVSYAQLVALHMNLLDGSYQSD
jgi:hypothetical protein